MRANPAPLAKKTPADKQAEKLVRKGGGSGKVERTGTRVANPQNLAKEDAGENQ
jgi:hypothetical protein